MGLRRKGIRMNEPEHLVRAYIGALSRGDTDAILELFAPSGAVESPLYGIKRAVDFYRDLEKDTKRSTLQLQAVYVDPHDPRKAAIHFRYRWEMKNGEIVTFSCVDLFEFTGPPLKVSKLSIVYDTHPIRAAFTRQHSS